MLVCWNVEMYLYEANSCFSPLASFIVTSDRSAVLRDTGTGHSSGNFSPFWSFRIRSRKNLFMSYLGFQKTSIPGIFSFHFHRHILNFWRRNCRLKKALSDHLRGYVSTSCVYNSKVSIAFYLLCSRCHQTWIFPHKVFKKLFHFIINPAIVSYK